MKTAIITYQIPHLKTAQILERLAQRKSAGQIDVFAIPFRPFKSRDVVFKHRPDQNIDIKTPDLCAQYGFGYTEVEADADIPGGYDYYVITGAGILSPECVRGKKIVNSHPGAIPAVRGLDAFKWAIHDMQPMANTLHYVDEAVDMGELITIEPTPVYVDDTLEILATRLYDSEIALLARFDDFIGKGPYISTYPEREATRRMPAATEHEMMTRFEEYKNRFAVDKKKEGTNG
jgi:phosphoribosylglycinamide formyltransferase-1